MDGRRRAQGACFTLSFAALFLLPFAVRSARAGYARRGPLDMDVRLKFPSAVRLEADAPDYSLYEVRFPSPVRSLFERNNTVWGHLYIPKNHVDHGRPAPCILVLPMMAAPNVWIETRFMNAFVAKGYAVFWLEMPYQFHRVPAPLAPSGQAFLSRTPRGLAANFRQAVLDTRRAVSWLNSSGRVDPGRIAVFGVSLGAMVGSAALSVDDRLEGGVFLLGGADLPDIVMRSAMTRPYVRKMGISERELREALRGLDPSDYRERNKGKRVFLVNALWDRVVDRRDAEALHRAFPDSVQVWVPLGHYSSIIHIPWMRYYAAGRFSRIFSLGDKGR